MNVVLGLPTPSQLVASAYGMNVQIIPAPSLHVTINGRPFQNFGTAFASVVSAAGSVLHNKLDTTKASHSASAPFAQDYPKIHVHLNLMCVAVNCGRACT
jgi:hypothetical protein